jgi:DNA-directed RNA polymerase sigma subunit (sigma70/sigma32)
VSAERIRQIEVAAMKKMKAALTAYAEAWFKATT